MEQTGALAVFEIMRSPPASFLLPLLALLASACVSWKQPRGRTARVATARGFVRVAACDSDAERYVDSIRPDAASRFHEMMLVVERGDVDLRGFRITFGDGRPFAPSIRTTYRSDSASEVITLPDAPRVIAEINLDYGRHSDDARIELWAR